MISDFWYFVYCILIVSAAYRILSLHSICFKRGSNELSDVDIKLKLDNFQAVLEDMGSCVNDLSGDNSFCLDTKYKSIVSDISSARSTMLNIILQV